MRILHLAYSCTPGEFRGGIGKVVYQLSVAQRALGHEVTVFAPDRYGAQVAAVPVGVPVENDGVVFRYFSADFSTWAASSALRETLLAEAARFDAMHSHNTFLALNCYAREAKRLHGTPLFFHPHGSLDPIVLRRPWSKWMKKMFYIALYERRNYQMADALFALSRNEAAQIRGIGVRQPIYVVSNGMTIPEPATPAEVAQFRQRVGLTPGSKTLLYLGRINPKKGLDVLLNAFALVAREIRDWTLVIGGDREEEPEYTRKLDRIVTQQRIAPLVRWAGFLNESEKRGAFGCASVFSHVSQSEGMAMAVLEAMAVGLPVIVSPGCYMPKAVAAGVVRLSPYDACGLAAELRALFYGNFDLAELGRRSRAYVREHHGWDRIARTTVDIYDGRAVGTEAPAT